MTVTPIQLSAAPADKSAAGAARAENPSASQFAHVLGGTRNTANVSRGPAADAAGTRTTAHASASTAKLAPDAGHTPRPGKQPLPADPQHVENKADDDATGLAALMLPVNLPTIAEAQSASRTNAGSGHARAAAPSQAQTSDTPDLLKLAGRAALKAPGQPPAAEPADAVAQRVAARLTGEGGEQHTPPYGRSAATPPASNPATAAASTQRIDALFSTTTGAASLKPIDALLSAITGAASATNAGQVAVGAAADPNVLRRALDAVVADVGQKAERTASSKTDPALLPAQSPAVHAGAPGPNAPAAAPAAPAPAALNQPVGDPGWNQALAQQSLRLHHAGAGRAELQLHPKELGTLQISLQMGEQVQVHISSPHAHVRAAVENALPQLRQAFADSGIALGDTSVGHQSAQQQHGSNQRRRGAVAPGAVESGTELAVTHADSANKTLVSHFGPGGIDIFA